MLFRIRARRKITGPQNNVFKLDKFKCQKHYIIFWKIYEIVMVFNLYIQSNVQIFTSSNEERIKIHLPSRKPIGNETRSGFKCFK